MFGEVKPVEHVKTMWELSMGTGTAVYNSMIEILKQDPEIALDHSVNAFWDQVSLIEFRDNGVSLTYEHGLGNVGTGPTADFKMSHVSLVPVNITTINTAARQKLIELLADGGLNRHFNNTIVGADSIMVERFNALTDNAVLYFENKT